MHAAAEGGEVEKLKSLLINGNPLQKDNKLRTPLHYAAEFTQQKKAKAMVEAILQWQPNQNKQILDSKDTAGNTALHLAANAGHPEVVSVILSSQPDLNIKYNTKTWPMELIYDKVPSVMTTAYDGSVKCNKDEDPDNQNLTLVFDFASIIGVPEPGQPGDRKQPPASNFYPEAKWLSYCLGLSDHKQEIILMHPVVQAFLFLKWKKIRILQWLSIVYHILWLILYAHFNVDLYLVHCPFSIPTNDSQLELNATELPITKFENASLMDNPLNLTGIVTNCYVWDHYTRLNAELWVLFVITVSIAVKELFEFFSSRKKTLYLKQLENYGQWLVVGIVFLASIPVFQVDDTWNVGIYEWQYQASAFGILVSCSLVLSQIGKIPRFGIYTLILAKVVRSFFMFMITFSCILIAFMISFQILMPEKHEFSDNPWGFIRVLVMVTGEINYDNLFNSEAGDFQLPFPTSTKLTYLAFIAVVTIILFNLLVGLTVSDIQGLQSVAAINSSSIQVEEIYLMEKFLMSNNIQKLLRICGKLDLLRCFLVTQQVYSEDFQKKYGSFKFSTCLTSPKIRKHYSTIVATSIKGIPKELHEELRILASRNTHSDTQGEQVKSLTKENIEDFNNIKRKINTMLQEFLDDVISQNASSA